MNCNRNLFAVLVLLLAAAAAAEQELDTLMEKAAVGAVVKSRSEGVLVKESTAVGQAQAAAQSRSEFGMELRPRISNDDVGAALRIFLPSRWSKSKLKEQLALVAREEQLRVEALEWQELMGVYRGFCEYRMLKRQLETYRKELEAIEPYLERADKAVELNQLAVTERAKLYSRYLDLVNDEEKVKADLLQSRLELQLLVGAGSDLDAMAEVAVIKMPPKNNFETMLKTALENRSDFRMHDVRARSVSAAEAVARDEDGFRLKYIQPDFRVDYNNGETSYGLSASFILPWGTRNPDIRVYRNQHALSLSVMELQRTLIADRLKVLLDSAQEYYEQESERSARIKPLLKKLNDDLKSMETGRLEEFRDTLLVRERILDVSLQTTRAMARKERIAVGIAEELGTLAQ